MKIHFTRSHMPFLCPPARAAPPARPLSVRAAIWLFRLVQNRETAAAVGSSGVWSGKFVVLQVNAVRVCCGQRGRFRVAVPKSGPQLVLGGRGDLIGPRHPDALEVLGLEPESAAAHADAVRLDKCLCNPR